MRKHGSFDSSFNPNFAPDPLTAQAGALASAPMSLFAGFFGSSCLSSLPSASSCFLSTARPTLPTAFKTEFGKVKTYVMDVSQAGQERREGEVALVATRQIRADFAIE